MAPTNIVIALGLAERLIQRVTALDHRVRVTRLSAPQRRVYRAGRPVWYEPYEPPEVETETPEEAARNYSQLMGAAEVLFTTPVVPADLQTSAPRLRWIQSTAAGADRLLDNPLARSGVAITTASGIHAIPIGEYVIAAILAFAKGFPAAIHSQEHHEWRDYLTSEIHGKTLGIIGLGAIGGGIARLARPFGVRILALRRSISARAHGAETGNPDVDELLPPAGLPYLLQESDYVAISMPLTPETRHLIGERELALMKDSAFLINISRGAIIDEPALIRALQKRTIAGAALDVFEKEPLPAESELWGLPNVILTPHASGSSPLYMDRAIDLFCDNLRRYLDGQPLRNRMDPDRGY